MLERGTALRKSLKIWVMKWILIERVSQYLLLGLKYLFEFDITRFHNKCLMCGEYHTPITIKRLEFPPTVGFSAFNAFLYYSKHSESTSGKPKGAIRRRKSKKDTHYNGQKKKDERSNNDIQNITHKTKDRATRTTLKPWVTSVVNALRSNQIVSSNTSHSILTMCRIFAEWWPVT